MPVTPPLTPVPLERQIAKFDPTCGGLPLQQAVNLIGQLLGTLYNPDSGTILISVGGSSFIIPEYDKIDFTYVSGGVANDDLIATQVFSKDAVTVATLTYAYVGATNNITSITLS